MLGSEGKGLRRRVAESCDLLISIPVRGRVGSLNVSAAAAVLLFEAVRQRGAQAERRLAAPADGSSRSATNLAQRARRVDRTTPGRIHFAHIRVN